MTDTSLELDMSDLYLVHSYFILYFYCETCHREMIVRSAHAEFTVPWYIDQANQARSEGWFVPPLEDDGLFGLYGWCAECADRLGLTGKESSE